MGWTPVQRIRVLVLGLVRDGDRFLFAEVERSDGSVKGLRPLGGSIEFGETRETALAREFREEIGAAVRIDGPWSVLENLFEHEGAVGHEIVFLAPATIDPHPPLDSDGRFRFLEADTRCRGRWASPAEAAAEGLDLYPAGLAALLAGGRGSRSEG